MELIFVTHNANKAQEVQAMMPEGITIKCLKDINFTDDIPETANTVAGNAILKVEYVKERLHCNCFADDTGLMVNALHGAPGVYSARYAGEKATAQQNMDKLLQEMRDESDRRARFVTCIALNLEREEILFEGICEGTILEEPRGTGGFGYDPIFVPVGSDKTFAEMSLSEKADYSHRGKAILKLINYLQES